MDPLLFIGSLVAVLALAGVARLLGLGHIPQLADADAARAAADAAMDGFVPVRLALDRAGRGAVLADGDGRLLLLKPHGNHFAGRLLGGTASASLHQVQGETCLVVDSGERRYGSAALVIDDPEAWARAINGLNANDHA